MAISRIHSTVTVLRFGGGSSDSVRLVRGRVDGTQHSTLKELRR